ncbi:ATP-binding cassette domain-containing protein, partial [Enterococcus faecalis]|nr:ATP-binding cassette domain-containing protein [Enterococcus faecalis]
MDPKHDDGAPGPGATPAVPAAGAPLLEIRDLDVEFTTQQGTVQAVEGASLTLPAGGTLAIVGESGSGKSTTAMAAIGLLPGNGRVTAGSVRFAGAELV